MSYQVECPNNTYMCYDNLVKIMKNIKEQQDNVADQCSSTFNSNITSCSKIENSSGDKNNSCNNCDYLFEKLVKGDTTCKELFDSLNGMQIDELKAQIKYNLYQLVHMKTKIEPARVYGTFTWWKKYIWGINKIQNYIYIVSFTIALIMISYLIYENISTILSDYSTLWAVVTLISAIVVCIIIMVYTLKDVEYKPASISYDKRIVESKKAMYGKKVRDNWTGDKTEDTTNVAWIISVIIICYFIILGFEYLGLSKLIGQRFGDLLHNFMLFTLIGLVIAINMFYTFLIPQFIIVGIILQKILITGGKDIKLTVMRVIILAFILGFTSYESVREEETTEKGVCTQDENPNIIWQYAFIFVALFVMFILYELELWGGIDIGIKSFTDNNNGLGLFLEPYISVFKNIQEYSKISGP